MNKLLYLFSFGIIFSFHIHAQNDTIKYDVGLQGVTSSGTNSPFWLESNQYGKISSNPSSFYQLECIYKDFGKKNQIFDYGFKANLLIRTDDTKSDVYFHEIYAKARLSVFDLIIGSREEHLGNQDSTLSCGGILVSLNTRPMPKITVGIEHFTTIPFTKGYLEIKGALVHGWFSDNSFVQQAMLHHKYAHIKLGGKLPIHLQYGLDHVAQWGGISPVANIGQQPTSIQNYFNIFFGRSGGKDANISDQINALGNHIISQSTRLDIDIKDYKISGYWQNVSEDGPIKFITNTMNVPDGLWGITIRNPKFPLVKGILYEYLNTTDQSGPYHDKDGIIYGGADSYFENSIYNSGWTYYKRIIGTPFISLPTFNSSGEMTFLNNRVQVHHIGIEGDIASYQYRILSSFSKNYGSYFLALNEERRNNTSVMLEIKKQFPKLHNIEFGCTVAADFGKLYGNSVGSLFSIRKRGDLFHY